MKHIFNSVKSLEPYGLRLFSLYQRHALDVPFDRKVIQIREIGDSREGLPRGILKMLHRMRETKCRVKPFAVWLYVPKDIGIYGF